MTSNIEAFKRQFIAWCRYYDLSDGDAIFYTNEDLVGDPNEQMAVCGRHFEFEGILLVGDHELKGIVEEKYHPELLASFLMLAEKFGYGMSFLGDVIEIYKAGPYPNGHDAGVIHYVF